MKNLLLIVLTGILFLSCVTTPEQRIPKRVEFRLMVENIGETQTIAGNTITVNEIKFLFNNLQLITPESDTLNSFISAILAPYNEEMAGTNQVLLEGNLGIESINNFEQIKFNIIPSSSRTGINDTDINPGTQLSTVIKGIYKDQEFTYKSDTSKVLSLTFDPNESITDRLETFIALMKIDAHDLFLNADTLINPVDQFRNPLIDSLFLNSINAEGIATSIVNE